MPYNLRPRKNRKNRTKAHKPPPDSSDDSSDEDFAITMTFVSSDKKEGDSSKKTSPSKKATPHKEASKKRKPDASKKTESVKKTSVEPINERTESQSPLDRVIERLMNTYGRQSSLNDFIVDDEDDSDDEYDPDDDDDDDDDELVVLGNGMMTLGGMMGMGKKNPYDIRLPPSKLTPELLEYLQNMPNILGKPPKPGEDIDAFRELPKERQKTIIKSVKQVANVIDNEEHPYFRILSLPIDANSKRTALERQISVMNAENSMMSESNPKAQSWVRGFLSIPFGKYRQPSKRAKKDSAGYLRWSMDVMNGVAYGMDDAKDHILRYVAQMITNPKAAGNCLAFLGPPGTGKTSLIRNGLGKILNRPVHMIALGGNTDASVLEGHGYTYEGSVWGQIADILIRSKCMNPVIIFDELDKVSGTSKGDEIIGLLTHITDSTQNTAFQDKYFAGINIDLSRVLFVFTLNNRDTVNPVLMDRLRTIHTKGYSKKEKHIIGEKYLLPRLLKHYAIKDLVISEDAWQWILNERKEDGVRNLKRDLETIVSRLNLLQLFRISPSTDKTVKDVKSDKSKDDKSDESKDDKSDESKDDKSDNAEESNIRGDAPVEPSGKTATEEDLPKGVPRGIKWTMGDTLCKDDVQVLLEGRNTKNSSIPFGMYC